MNQSWIKVVLALVSVTEQYSSKMKFSLIFRRSRTTYSRRVKLSFNYSRYNSLLFLIVCIAFLVVILSREN